MKLRGLCAVAVLLTGCGLSPQQNAVKAKLESEIKSPVTYENWWPAVTADAANFPVLFAGAKVEGDSSAENTAKWEVLKIVEMLVAEKKPTHVVRVKYRAPVKDGQPMTQDMLFFLVDTDFAFLWPAASEDSLQAFKDWQIKNFP